MKIKHLGSLILLTATTISVNAQIRPTAHEWRATVTAVDERAQPVAGAEITIGFSTDAPEGGSIPKEITGKTDTNGVFFASHLDRSLALGIRAKKAGHYPFWIQHELGFSPEEHPDRLKPKITVLLKRVIKPIPMYARSIRKSPPVLGQPVGYDLIVGDWVSPHGKGVTTHIIFTRRSSLKSANEYENKITVSLPNPGDGIQEFTVPAMRFTTEGSALRSPHEAPEHGYLAELTRESYARPGQARKHDFDASRNYFIRVCTVLDEDGNVKSALYGKFYGDFMQFTYYLNPTPNDRNVEFDPKQNLSSGLKPTERVDAP